MSTAEAPIMLRAAITREEWTQLRKIALDRNESTQALVAEALRRQFCLDTGRDDTK